MAMIKCSECGKQMSDKAKNCPHCGCENNVIVCSECGEIITDKKVKSCPKCGMQIQNNMNKFFEHKNLLFGIILIILLVIVIIVMFMSSKSTSSPTIGSGETIDLNDDNIEDYIVIKSDGDLEPTTYSYEKYNVDTEITPSINGSRCDNVSFELEITMRYIPWTTSSSTSESFTETVTLDSGCNYNETSSGWLDIGGKTRNISDFSYDITNATGTITVD